GTENTPAPGNFVDKDGNAIDREAYLGEPRLVDDVKPVTFKTTSDSDKIVETIKNMVSDYNEMVTEIKKAYSTMPEQRSNGQYYEPLTEEDMEGMSDREIEKYEEKAKTGILFGDYDLSSLYSRLRDAVQMAGKDGADLAFAGIGTSYSDGLTTLTLDENKLRSALETDPDRVTEIFTKSQDSGSATDGLMQALKKPLNTFGAVTGATKGVLVQKAGSILSPTSIYQNTIQQQLDALDDSISSWQDKINDKIDYYTSKFTQLEKLVNEMNSQSSALMGLMGGGGSY
ncbi:MAG: flagellar filament capping protein FliD, partial [Clostridia bacterium]|nr:flagellar filament capping protein FliD [Clostridia bacterium]